MIYRDKWTPLKLVKRALRLFLHSKNRTSKQHEYSLVILQDQAMWVRFPFTEGEKNKKLNFYFYHPLVWFIF